MFKNKIVPIRYATGTRSSFLKAIFKVLRYSKTTGILRTLSKIKGTYHLKADLTFTGEYWENKSQKNNNNSKVAIVGCGYYAYANIAYYLKKENSKFLRCAMDIDSARARSLCLNYKGSYATTNLQKVLEDQQVKLVYIATKHSFHCDYAIKCIEAGKDVHIEKPHVLNEIELDRLSQALDKNPGVKVFLGFNRPKSRLFKELKLQLSNYSGSMMINWFLVGHYLEPSHWYFDGDEGGRVLGNLCHWTDATINLIGINNSFPLEINPTRITDSDSDSDSDFVITITFNDKSTAVFSFSAKGWVSKGIIESLRVQKGDCVAAIDCFDKLNIDAINMKKTWRNTFRDHGHQNNILFTYKNSMDVNGHGESKRYIIDTARLFLAVDKSIRHGKKIILEKL
jgi:predicted dehydrogenase